MESNAYCGLLRRCRKRNILVIRIHHVVFDISMKYTAKVEVLPLTMVGQNVRRGRKEFFIPSVQGCC